MYKNSSDFSRASIGLLLNILENVNSTNMEKYYKFFQKELNISSEEFKEIQKEYKSIDIDKEVDTIIEILNSKRHKVMNFLMMLNRCIIIDGCTFESYNKFEKIRDKFLSKI